MDDFSRGHLFLLKHQGSFHETHEYDHSLLFYVEYQATPRMSKNYRIPTDASIASTDQCPVQFFPLLFQCSFLNNFFFFFFSPSSPSHVRNFLLTNLNAPEAAFNCPEPKGRNKDECRSNSTEILLAPMRITAGQKHPCVFKQSQWAVQNMPPHTQGRFKF